jgi:hypothetical protein
MLDTVALNWLEFPTPECTFWKMPERKMPERRCPKKIARTKIEETEFTLILRGIDPKLCNYYNISIR